MKKRFASLTRIEHDRPVGEPTDSCFLRALKLGLLLALREVELLTDPQLRLAMDELGVFP